MRTFCFRSTAFLECNYTIALIKGRGILGIYIDKLSDIFIQLIHLRAG